MTDENDQRMWVEYTVEALDSDGEVLATETTDGGGGSIEIEDVQFQSLLYGIHTYRVTASKVIYRDEVGRKHTITTEIHAD